MTQGPERGARPAGGEDADVTTTASAAPGPAAEGSTETGEVGGPPGPEPTRFGDWERKGRCIDF
jgi:hypothetical protein